MSEKQPERGSGGTVEVRPEVQQILDLFEKLGDDFTLDRFREEYEIEEGELVYELDENRTSDEPCQ